MEKKNRPVELDANHTQLSIGRRLRALRIASGNQPDDDPAKEAKQAVEAAFSTIAGMKLIQSA